jgi:hypothetical protein
MSRATAAWARGGTGKTWKNQQGNYIFKPCFWGMSNWNRWTMVFTYSIRFVFTFLDCLSQFSDLFKRDFWGSKCG